MLESSILAQSLVSVNKQQLQPVYHQSAVSSDNVIADSDGFLVFLDFANDNSL